MLTRNIAGALVLSLAPASTAFAQSEPYKVFDTRPVITEGPYLVASSATATTIVWMTDTPSHSLVRYAKGSAADAAGLLQTVEPQVDGLVPVGVRHVVHLTGLEPGATYSYQVISTRVVKLKAYWPDKGLAAESRIHSFRTLDPAAPRVAFSVVTDTHEDVARINRLMKMIDWTSREFLVHTGDAFHWIDSEDQLFRAWLTPTTAALAHARPLMFARGNHELRGPFARQLFDYVPNTDGRFYFARDAGPVHLLVLDSGEDKPDDTNVYARLNRTMSYRDEEFRWLEAHVMSAPRVSSAPFRVVVMHQPRWGWLADGNGRWIELANRAKVDLIIAGHNHRFSYTPPGTDSQAYHLVVVGQDQVADVEATATTLRVIVKGTDGATVHELVIPRR